MIRPTPSLRNLLTALTFVILIALPPVLHAVQKNAVDSSLENRRLAEAPGLAELRADWAGFPDRINAWMRDHFGLRRSYLKIGFSVDRVLSASAGLQAVRGDDGWLFSTLNGSLAQHQGLLPFAAGEADAWLDALEELQTRAEGSRAVFLAVIPPNKHTIYAEKLSDHPRQVAGETRLDELHRLAETRGLPLVDLRAGLTSAKAQDKVYYQTDTHWTELGAYHGFRVLRTALIERGVSVPELPRDALDLVEDQEFRGDIYGLLGEEDGAPETIYRVKVQPAEDPAGSILIIGDSFSGQWRKYFDASFDEVSFAGNAGGDPELAPFAPGSYDVILFQIVERYLSNPLTPRFQEE